MYMLNNKHIVKEGQSLDLHRLLDTNKVYLKDIFESDNETFISSVSLTYCYTFSCNIP